MRGVLHPAGLRGVFLKAQLTLEAELSMLLICMCIAAFLYAAISHASLATAAIKQQYSSLQLSDSAEFADAFSLLPKPAYTAFLQGASQSSRLSNIANSTYSKTIAEIFGYEVKSIEKEPM